MVSRFDEPKGDADKKGLESYSDTSKGVSLTKSMNRKQKKNPSLTIVQYFNENKCMKF